MSRCTLAALEREELLRPAEEPVRLGPPRVVDAVRRADSPEVREPQQEGHGQSLVDEAVVHHEVGEAERGHADARSHEDRSGRARELAPDDDEQHRERGVETRQGVVPFEATLARLVVRGVDAPERAVPEPPVEEARPRLHRARGEHGGRESDQEIADHGRSSPARRRA